MLENEIDDDGAKAIAKALESNTTLTTIDLGSKWFECRVYIYHWLMHVSSESFDQFHWRQSDWSGIAAQHNVDIDRSCEYVLASVCLGCINVWSY
jgi:hypothetical protein